MRTWATKERVDKLLKSFNYRTLDFDQLFSRRREPDMVGLTINEEIVERIIHELCHAAVFNMKLDRFVGDRVSEAFVKRPSLQPLTGVLLTHRANNIRADRAEIRTIAVETIVLDVLPIRYDFDQLLDNAGENMRALPKADIYRLGAEFAKEEITHTRAMRVLDWLLATAA